MRKILLISLVLLISKLSAQTYDVLNYNYNGTPVNGVKIKTMLPLLMVRKCQH